MGQFLLDAGNADVNPALLNWIQLAAQQSPFNVRLQSGYREGDPRYHGKKMAIDVQLIDPKTGKVIPNYQTADSFQAYQQFADTVRGVQMQANPELAPQLRWGGYFSGPKGNYGSMDLMHFDIGGDKTPMGGGGWDTGLTPAQAKLWGLAPGGGYSGAGTVAPVLAGAVDGATGTPPEEEGFDFAGLAKSARQSMASRGAPSVPQPAVSQGAPPAAYDFASAAPPPMAAPAAGPSELPPLADLFQVGEIGGAGRKAANPYAPPRRREV